MKQLLKTCAAKTFSVGNLFPSRMTDRDELLSMMERLRPVSCDKELIRLGPGGDGGYLIPDDLNGIEACFSPGVSLVSGFERDCADLGMKVFLADKSVEQPTETHKLFDFTRKFIGVTSDDDFMTFDDWVTSSLPGSRSDLMMQMDIEGYEYEVLLAMSELLMSRFRIIVTEFHRLDHFWNKPYFSIASRAFEKILQSHSCVHIHPNNSCGSLDLRGLTIPGAAEFTFLRKDRITNPSYRTDFPHTLDYDNTDTSPLVLPGCWYGEK